MALPSTVMASTTKLEPVDRKLRDDHGFLILESTVEGKIPDHRDLRKERIVKLTR